MRILLLGPLELRTDHGVPVHVGGSRRRAVLAALALEANRVVPVERLIDLTWDHAPPSTARAALQGHIARLRTLLDGGLRLDTRAPGYVLHADPELIDAHRLDLLLGRARATAGDGTAVPLLREALALWRGPALEDCGSAALRRAAAGRLETLRIEALEQLAERLLRTGRGRSVTAELTTALADHPLRESLIRLTLLCLHQEGRPAEAVAVYEEARRRLAEEAGIDPGPALREALAQLRSTADEAPAPAPARLPRAPGRFIGRESELAWLSDQCGTARATGRLLLVTGPAGVGKTALVLRWSHRLGP
ncbi:BTAD domain-containing putative transcriptional regulator, partial [Kitasatospora sp. NPDC001159]